MNTIKNTDMMIRDLPLRIEWKLLIFHFSIKRDILVFKKNELKYCREISIGDKNFDSKETALQRKTSTMYSKKDVSVLLKLL